MMKDSIEEEVNLIAARKKKIYEGEWRREEGERRREDGECRRDGGEWRREEGERGEIRKDKETEQPSTSSSQETGIDIMMRTMERMMERLSVDGTPPPRENQDQQTRTLNAIRP